MRILSCCLVLTLCAVLNTTAASLLRVLQEDPQVGRTSPVLSQHLRIRLQPGVLPSYTAEWVERLIPEVEHGRSMLKPEQTVSYNPAVRQNFVFRKSKEQLLEVQKAEELLLRTFVVRYTGEETPEQMAQFLMEKYPIIEIAEPYYVQRLLGAPPNDPYYPQQVMLHVLRAADAWDVFPGDSTIVIGIADSGVLQEHEDLENSLWINQGEIPNNYIDDDGNGYVDDWRGCNFAWRDDGSDPNRTFGNAHGTMVAGLAGATVNNGIGIAGVANRCKIFPMKTMPNNSQFIIYGYDAIIYSAVMGFAVVNCSWGSSAASVIEQSIVDFATARGTAVVAGAGNHGSDDPFYPAAFPNALGVGVCTVDDEVTQASAYGSFVPIFTPAQGAWTTANNGDYGTFGFTSAASPVGAAAVALARARYPELNASQAITFVRQCVVDISAQNQRLAPYSAKRLDLYPVVTKDPFAAPGLRYVRHQFLDRNGIEARQFQIGDTIVLRVHFWNDLGTADILSAHCSIFFADTTLALLSAEDSAFAIQSGKPVAFSFQFRMNATQAEAAIFRIDVDGQPGDYQDQFFVKFTPTTAPLRFYTNFDNGIIHFSMADRGTIGFANTELTRRTAGDGFQFRNIGNLLYEAGVFAVSGNIAVSSVRGVSAIDDDFAVIKGYVPPEENVSIIQDLKASPQRIGIQITQSVLLPEGSGIAAVRVKVQNVSGSQLPELAIGYFFDWDIGPFGEENWVRMQNQLLRQLGKFNGAVGVLGREGGYPLVLTGALALDGGARVQFAGFHNDPAAPGTPFGTYDGFTDGEKRMSVTSDTTLHFDGSGDVGCVTGVYWDTPIENGEEREFILLFGAAENETQLLHYLAQTLEQLGVSSSAENTIRGDAPVKVYYRQPLLTLVLEDGTSPEYCQLSLFSLNGRKVADYSGFIFSHSSLTLPVGRLSVGQYIVNLQFGEKVVRKILIISPE